VLKDRNFLRIISIFKGQNGEIFLKGHLLSRQSSWGTAMPKRKNKLVWILEVSNADFEAGVGTDSAGTCLAMHSAELEVIQAALPKLDYA
jgi:hypothetical protein